MSHLPMEDILKSWGLENLIPIFKEQQIDMESLKALTPHHICQLTPIIGLQAKLEKHVKELNNKEESGSVQSVGPCMSHEFISEASTTPATSESSYDEPIPGPSGVTRKRRTDDDDDDDDSHDSLSLIGSSVEPSSIMAPNSYEPKSCFAELDIRKLLQEDLHGPAVLRYYDLHKVLSDLQRKRLTKIVVEHTMCQSHELTKIDFAALAQGIIKTFPCECKETYFIPSYKKRQSRGKLVDKYRNLRTILKLRQPKHTTEEASEDVDDFDEKVMQEHQVWMQTHTTPFTEYSKRWKETTKYRQRTLLGNKERNLQTIFNEWPGLKQEFASQLIELDFTHIYRGKENSITERWPAIEEKVIAYMKREFQEKDPTAYLSLQTINALNENKRHFVVFKLLPKIIKNPFLCSGNKRWKPSTLDTLDSFILLVQDPTKLEERINDRRTLLQQKGLTLQPFIVAVGTLEEELENFFVFVDEFYYKSKTLITALDLTFKVYQTLNLSYPVECSAIWEFIQKCVYEVHTPHDKNYASVAALVNFSKQ